MEKTEARRSLLLILLLTGLLWPAGIPLNAQSGWSPMESGTTSRLNRISWSWIQENPLHPGILRVAGDFGTFIQSDDGGDSWSSPSPVPTVASLNALDFPYPDTGYVVGDGATMYRVLRVGNQYQFSIPTSVPTTENLNCVTSIPLTISGFAAGDKRHDPPYDDPGTDLERAKFTDHKKHQFDQDGDSVEDFRLRRFRPDPPVDVLRELGEYPGRGRIHDKLQRHHPGGDVG